MTQKPASWISLGAVLVATAEEFSGFERAELQRLDDYFRPWLLREGERDLSPGDVGP